MHVVDWSMGVQAMIRTLALLLIAPAREITVPVSAVVERNSCETAGSRYLARIGESDVLADRASRLPSVRAKEAVV
jgi:hypothetical protein